MSAAAFPIGAAPHAERVQWPVFGMIVMLHAAALLALTRPTDTPHAFALRPVTVSAFLYTEEPAPKVVAPKPVPAQPPPQPKTRTEPVVAAPHTAPAPPMTEAAPVPPPPVQTATPLQPPQDLPPAAVPEQPSVPAPPPVTPPRFDADYLDNPAPAYPSLSRRLGEEGLVLLRVYVERDGTPARLEVRQTSGYARLDQAALKTVRRWRFVPARRGEATIAGWVVVPISFQLRRG